MSDGLTLLASCVENPEDDTARLVYADWLEEQGQLERAEFMRAQIQLTRDSADSPQRRALALRARRLLDQHQQEWLASLQEIALECVFRRGFVEHVLIDAGDLGRRAVRRLFESSPVRSLGVIGLENVAQLRKIPVKNRLRVLDLTGNWLSSDVLPDLARLRALASLGQLGLQFNRLDDSAIGELCHNRFFVNLDCLRLGANPLTDAARQTLTETLRGVTFVCEREPDHLYTFDECFTTGFTADHRQVLANYESPEMRIVTFDFEGNFLGVERRPFTDTGSSDVRKRPGEVWSWLGEMGWTSGPIRVKRFQINREFSILDFADSSEDAFRRARLDVEWRADARNWVFKGMFEWNETHSGRRGPPSSCWIDRNGEVPAAR